MVKCRVAPPKYLFHVTTQTEKDRYTLIEQSAQWVLLKIGIYITNTIQLYNYIISLPIALHNVYMQLRYIMCMILLL